MKKYYRIHKVKIMIHVVVSMIAALLMVGVAFVYQGLTKAATGNNFQHFLFMAIFAVAFLVVEAYFDYVPRWTKSRVVQGILTSMREDLTEYYENQSLTEVLAENPANRTNLLIHDLSVMEEGYLKPLLTMLSSFFVFCFSLIGALSLQSTFTGIMIMLTLVPLASPVLSKWVLSKKKQEVQQSKKSYLKKFEEFSTHLVTLRLANSGESFIKRLTHKGKEVETKTVSFEKAQGKTYAISYGLGNVVYSGTWIIGGYFVFKGQMDLPALIAMTTLMSMIAGPIQYVSDSYADLVASKEIVQEFLALLQDHSNEKPATKKYQMMQPIEEISLNDVSYQVEGRLLFSNVTARFVKGKAYAIQGESGTGKSTLLQIILGMTSVTSGSIVINGVPLTEIEMSSYYQQVAYVQQKTAMFDASVADNVTLFQKKEKARIVQALKQAGLSDWLGHQEKDIETSINHVQRLSGGEERRLDIARGLYRQTSMIILDEPTTGLDEKNEQAIADVLQELQECLLIVVTHSTNPHFLNIFDEILTLQDGELCQLQK